MKLSRTMKKVAAYLCAVALVVAGITYTPSTTKAEDYSSLTYQTIECQGGGADDLNYAIVSNDITGWADPWYGDGGITLQFVYAGGDVNPADETTVKINGTETAAGSGAVAMIGAGLVKVNPSVMDDNAYTEVIITTKTGSATIVIKKGTPGTSQETEEVTDAPETEEVTNAPETEEVTDAPETEEVTDAPETEEVTDAPETEEVTDAPETEEVTDAPETEFTQLTDGNWTDIGIYKAYVGSWNGSTGQAKANGNGIIAQQLSSNWGNAWGMQVMLLFPEYTDAVNNGDTYTVEWPIKASRADGAVQLSGYEGNIDLTGAAQTLSTTLTIKEDGFNQAAVVVGMGYVGTSNPIEFSQPVVKDSTGKVVYPEGYVEPTTEEAPTSSDETTEVVTSEETTAQAAEYQIIDGTAQDAKYGNWTLWINTTNKVGIYVNPEDADAIKGYIVSNSNNWDQWGALQYKYNVSGLTADETYTISVDFATETNDGVVVCDNNESFDLATLFANGGKTTVSKEVKAAANGTISIAFGAGQVAINGVLGFSNVVIKDSEGNIVTPGGSEETSEVVTDPETESVEPSSEEPSVEPSSEAPSVEPSTSEATSSEVTTASEATTKAATVTVAKAKVKKATKKKSAKKVKVTITKVSGATGYQAFAYKTKANAKKSKKAVAKKTVKKNVAKITISGKKLKKAKKLFVRVRAYKVVSGKTYYGDWSKVKRVKIKK